jgi:hypothetical protein
MAALRALRKSPLAVDIYLWLTFKNSYSTKPTLIPWESLQIQFGAGYPLTPQGKLNFKHKFKEALAKVAEVYPEASKVKLTREGLFFVPGEPDVAKTKSPPKRK